MAVNVVMKMSYVSGGTLEIKTLIVSGANVDVNSKCYYEGSEAPLGLCFNHVWWRCTYLLPLVDSEQEAGSTDSANGRRPSGTKP